MKNRILLSGLLLTFFHLSLTGQVELKMLSPKKMKKDLEYFLGVLDAHPDPYTKVSEEDFQAKVKAVEQNISKELDEIDYYKNLAGIMGLIRDGHSSVYMPRFWMKEVRKKHGVFPYEMFLSNDNELFVVKSYGDEQLPLGTRILEINGMAVEAFVEAVTPYLSYETIPFRNDRISESFELMLYLVFKKADQLRFKFKVFEESEVVVSAMPYKEWRGQKKDLREEREKKIAIGQPYDFKILKPGIAKIDIFSFAVVGRNFDKYNFFLNKTFKQIKKNNVHSLIIDVRGNYGGWPKVASELFHYIHEGHFKTMAKSRMKVSSPYRKYYTNRYPGLKFNSPTIRQRRHYIDLDAVLRGTLDTYVDENMFFNESPITESHEFDGDCYVLIDRKSYSASSSFASTFQCYSMGILIGEPTGGTKIFRANAIAESLPRTGLWVRSSTTQLFTACFSQEDEPVLPNVEVIPTVLDRVHEVDSQLNTALMLIKKIQKGKKEKSEKLEKEKSKQDKKEETTVNGKGKD